MIKTRHNLVFAKTRQYSLSDEQIVRLHERLRETESWIADLKKENVRLQNLLDNKRNGTA